MQNGQSLLSDLFNADRIFKIPNYQRTYTWQEDNLKVFLDDIVNQRGNKPYFLGTFLFHKQENRGDYELLDIVDGQQRMTTIILFFKVLIERLKFLGSIEVTNKTYRRYVKDIDGTYKLELENEDNSYLNHYILENNSISTFETPAQKNLYVAKKYFQDELGKFGKEILERLYKVLKTAVVINYVVNDLSDATQIFELLNDRGRRLTNLEGIKSFMMYKVSSLKLKNHNQPIQVIQDAIAAIYRLIEKHSLNENDILRYHTIAFEDSNTENYNSPGKFIKNKVNQLFLEKKEDTFIRDEIVAYINRLKESFEIYTVISRNKIKSSHLDDFFMIGKVGPFYPFLMLVYQQQKEQLDEFCRILSRFTLRASFIGLQNRNEKFYEYIRNNNDFFKIFEEMVDYNWWNMNNRALETLEFENYYEWINKNIVKYILFKYENHLRDNEGHPLLTRKSYFDSNPRSKFNIEHISAKKSSLKFSNKFNEEKLHSIGNLVLDSSAPNSSKGKRGVDVKVKSYSRAPLMSQNEIKETPVNWKSKKEISQFITTRERQMHHFIKVELLKMGDE